MRLVYAQTLAVLLAAPLCATDPPVPAAKPPVVILPVAPKPDIPKPDTPVVPVLPDNVVKLVDDQVYDIVIKGPVVWRWHPAGVVAVSVKEVPAGREFEKEANFWDGKKTKVYPGPCTVHFLKAATPGTEPQTTDLDIIPIGFTDEKQITSLSITVNAQNPIPPPKPKPPEPKPPEPVTSFRVIFVYETGSAVTPAMQQAMGSEAVRAYLDAKTTGKAGVGKGWRKFDKDVDATNERDPNMKALWQAARPAVTTVPCVIIEVNGKADILPFPASEAESLALFKKYAEGK